MWKILKMKKLEKNSKKKIKKDIKRIFNKNNLY